MRYLKFPWSFFKQVLLKKHKRNKLGLTESYQSSDQESSDDDLTKLEMLKSTTLKNGKNTKPNQTEEGRDSDKDSEIYGEKEQNNSLIVQLEEWMVSGE